MDVAELCGWLEEHSEDLFAFTDYEVGLGSEDDASDNLELWFHDPDWNRPGHRFLHIGQDAEGGIIAVWVRSDPQMPAPVVFFGFGGSAGIVTPSPLAFVQALAHAPMFHEDRDDEVPARLSIDRNWRLASQEPERTVAAHAALARYHTAVEERFGPLPPFARLVAVPLAVQAEFRGWVASVQERASERRQREEDQRAEEKRRDLREKAARFAAAIPPPAVAVDLPDGTDYLGTCPACGARTTLRLTRYEELAFGICHACYFSNAW